MAKEQINFGDSNVQHSILSAAGPMLAAQLLNLLYNIVDRIFIGKIPGEGTLALAGVGICFPIVSLVTAFASLYGTGGAPLFSMERGKKNHQGARNILNNAFFMLLLTGITLTVIGILFQKPILYLFGASDVTYTYASEYMRIYMLGTIFVMISLGLNPYINSQGFARTGMMTVLIGAIANIILDPLFIFVFDMGVRGAAIATVISQFLSAVWSLYFLISKKTEIRISLREFRPDFPCIRQIISLGISSFVMSATNSLVQILCNAMLQTFGGDLYITAMTIINSIRQIAQTPVMAISDSASPVISYNYGAKDYELTKKAIRFMTQLGFAYTFLFWGLTFLFPEFFINIFNDDPALLEVTVPSMHIYFFGFCMMAFQFAGQSVFKALNYAKEAVFFSLLRKVFIVAPLTILLPYVGGLGVMGIFIAEPISNFIGGLACYITMQRKVLRKL